MYFTKFCEQFIRPKVSKRGGIKEKWTWHSVVSNLYILNVVLYKHRYNSSCGQYGSPQCPKYLF